MLHHLFVLKSEGENPAEAYRHAHEALAAYGPGHPRLPALVHDIACFWCEQGRFSRALSVLEALLPHITEPNERAVAGANLARAAAGTGNRARYEVRRQEAVDLLDQAVGSHRLAEAFINIARGDASVGDRERAEAAARRGYLLAVSRGEAQLAMIAEAEVKAARENRARETVPGFEKAGSAADRLASTILLSLSSSSR